VRERQKDERETKMNTDELKSIYRASTKLPKWGSYVETIEARSEQEAEAIFRSGLAKYGPDLAVTIETMEQYEARSKAARESYIAAEGTEEIDQ
jgi:hypothetical protein